MATYCTIEEAYKVPSFDTPARKKKMAPACQGGTNLGSSAGTVGFNPYGERAAFPAAAQQAAAQNPYSLLEYNEGFANMQQQTSTSYAGAAQDYDYMCRAYNICGPVTAAPGTKRITSNPPPVVQNQKPQAAKMPSQPGSQYLQEYFAYTNTSPASAHQAPVIEEGFANRACPAPAPQAYTVPISPEAKAQAAAALAVSLQQEQGPTLAPPAKGPIQGIYDEDLEQYLSTQQPSKAASTYVPFSPGYAAETPLNVQTALNAPRIPSPPETPATLSTSTLPPAPVPAPAPAPVGQKAPAAPKADSPFGAAMTRFWDSSAAKQEGAPFPVSETTPAHPLLDSPVTPRGAAPARVWWDLLLFVLAGILVIILLEQLFKIAMMAGMRRTVDILRPYLRDLE